jgi:putative membrane-bound dehydrogenase-like protein
MSNPRPSFALLGTLALSVAVTTIATAQETFIPRRQSKPPGPPLPPDEALAKMTVPEGFRVELVASEPQIMNPVAMAFDDRGRIYVTESFEYPRREAGPGRDRVKILEDTDGDGAIDEVKIFADGLNIPSGIAVGYGGVWVANAPDILFLEDTDGDDIADRRTVVATGFGRDDTHELPNALTWGPDGCLYGLNGVFNRSSVRQGDRQYDFTCAMFRIDPVSGRFDLFCEGTSNPWGIAFDDEGSAFVSACVIDHLWHLSETGYYHRQAGAYPPHTWKIDSIVDYKHQMAAYCGIEYFDSPAYPEPFRRKLYMGNIHGGCINVDSVARHGSTYRGTPHDDFLTANDVWFMPVAQKTGPDGCLYILDWYDRYHCYQDANADPEGVDRGHGRLYRIVHQQRPAVRFTDLGKLNSTDLAGLLSDPNVFFRRRAAVILGERLRSAPETAEHQQLVAALGRQFLQRWASAEAIDRLDRFPLYQLTRLLFAPQTSPDQLQRLLEHDHPLVVAWTVRAIASRYHSPASQTTAGDAFAALHRGVGSLSKHPDPRVRLQVAIAAGKIGGQSATEWLVDVLRHSEDDGLLPRIVWRNLEPRVVGHQSALVAALAGETARPSSQLLALAPRVAERLAASLRSNLSGPSDPDTLRSIVSIAETLAAVRPQEGEAILAGLVQSLQRGELKAAAAAPLLGDLEVLDATSAAPLARTAAALQLRAFAGEAAALAQLRTRLLDARLPLAARLQVLSTLARLDAGALTVALQAWADGEEAASGTAARWRDAVCQAVARSGDAAGQRLLISRLERLPVAVRASLAATLCQRQATAERLLEAIAEGTVPRDVVGPNQVRALAASRWDRAVQLVGEIWGTVRRQDSAARQRVVAEMQKFLNEQARGDAHRGWLVWDRVCGQCHVMHGRGYEVGPNLTRNGRGSFAQLVVSVFDPGLVIGNAYQSTSVLTVDGRVLSGIVIERGENRLVLRVQGGKTEVIPRDEIEEEKQNPQSLMPEGLEEQISRQEIADLFALLSLQKSPEAGEQAVIDGTPPELHRSKD